MHSDEDGVFFDRRLYTGTARAKKRRKKKQKSGKGEVLPDN